MGKRRRGEGGTGSSSMSDITSPSTMTDVSTPRDRGYEDRQACLEDEVRRLKNELETVKKRVGELEGEREKDKIKK